MHLPVLVPRFVGRERELAAARRALAAKGAVVLVEGEAGIGKSRLVRELLVAPNRRRERQAGRQDAGAAALVGACPPVRQPFTLGPIVDALRQATERVADLELTPLAGTLRPLFPEWASDLPAAPDPLADAAAARHRLFRALTEVLDRLGTQLLVVEDAHWTDEVTLEFLMFLAAREPADMNLLVTYRPEDVAPDSLLRRLSSRPSVTRVSVPPLDVAGTAALVSSMLDDEPVSAEFAELLCRQSDGLPLAIEESVRLLCDRADLIRENGAWVRRDVAEMVIPPSVRDAVMERAARLGQPGQSALRAAAVLGDPVQEATLVAVTGLPSDAASSGLAEALGSGLLLQDEEGRLAYRHALACRAVYEAIPPGDRREAHRRAARALEALHPQPVAELARHFREAAQTDLWCKYAEQAADLALASGDPMTAVTLLHDLLTQARLPAGEVVRLMRRIPIHVMGGDPRRVELTHRLRAVLDSEALTRAERAAVGWHLGRMMIHVGEFEAAYVELERAVPYLADRPADAAHTMVLLGWLGGAEQPAATHRRWLERAARITQDPAIPARDRVALLADQAGGLLALGEKSGWALAAQLPGEGRTPEEVAQVARALSNIGDEAVRWGRYEQAGRTLRRAVDLATSHHYDLLHDISRVTQLWLDWLMGSWDGLPQRLAELSGVDVEPLVHSRALLVAGVLDAMTGATRAAEGKLRRSLAAGRRPGIMDASLEPAAALARLYLSAERVDDALAVTQEPIDAITSKRIWLWATDIAPARVRALLAVGRTQEASRLVAAYARGLGSRGLDATTAPAPHAGLATCRALLAGARGQRPGAAAAFEHAATAWLALPRPYDAMLAREGRAGALIAEGREDEGLQLLVQAYDDLSSLGARVDAQRVGGTLRRYGRSAARSGRPSYGDRLSPRELDVVRLLATGRTNQQIARALSVSPRTVASHVDSAMRKRKVASRTGLAMDAIAAGVVAVPQAAGSPAEGAASA